MSKAWKTCKLIVRKKTFREQGKLGKTKESLAKKSRKLVKIRKTWKKTWVKLMKLGKTKKILENYRKCYNFQIHPVIFFGSTTQILTKFQEKPEKLTKIFRKTIKMWGMVLKMVQESQCFWWAFKAFWKKSPITMLLQYINKKKTDNIISIKNSNSFLIFKSFKKRKTYIWNSILSANSCFNKFKCYLQIPNVY